ncbi:TPA_asm: hypothetical protein [ssRNA phage Gerhypos.4_18]|uniref:Uncharacterized protein n=2 Tax=Leviviricetes TaxID=2842243 RepID=A0A8S5KZS9_9VIRU|nr:hypothetical protein QIP91_gp3 [ssRNA phage Gerhypos.4_18]QDH87556.1 MAG: hypothetical protein H4Bulk46477_000003 [Leviviridae sp.]DAD50362.1 TPA_asm: hypothetical protein [ssRNA phage Gerhypos.4_18]
MENRDITDFTILCVVTTFILIVITLYILATG